MSRKSRRRPLAWATRKSSIVSEHWILAGHQVEQQHAEAIEITLQRGLGPEQDLGCGVVRVTTGR